MKKLLFLGLGTALMITMAGVGSAQADSIGAPHNIFKGNVALNGTNYVNPVAGLGADACAGCHRAHTAKGTGFLLKDPQPMLCLNCHNGTISSLNVNTGTGAQNTALRGGGFVTAKIGTDAATKTLSPAGSRVSAQIPVGASAAVTSSHQINGTTTGTMWGNGTSGVGQTAVTLECGACHDPHGNGNYRILKPNPDGSNYVITPAVIAADGTVTTKAVMSATTTVNIPDQSVAAKAAGGYSTTNYWDVAAPGTPLTADENTANSVKAGTVQDGFLGGIAAWCTTCHTRYLSPTGGAGIKTSDPVFTYKHRSDAQADFKPNCIQCHVAHGTNATVSGYAAGVTEPTDGVTPASGSYQNSDLLRVNDRGTCIMCHTEGSPVVGK